MMFSELNRVCKNWLGCTALLRRPVVIIALLALLLAGITACSNSPLDPEAAERNGSASAYAGKKIVWVDSYHEGYAWSDGIEAGIREVLADTGVELKVIHMDTKRNIGDEYGASTALKVKREIDEFQPDVIIASDDNAQVYLVGPYFKDSNLPVVFCGVNWDASGYGYPTDNVTGMLEVELIRQLADHLKEYSQGDKIGFVTVNDYSERKHIEAYNERFFDGTLNVYMVKTYDEFKETFLKAQEEMDMLIIGNNAGMEWDEEEAMRFFKENTKIPTGTALTWMTPYAMITLGKKAEEQGEWSAKTALSIIDGTPVSEIPITENKKGNLIINLEIAEQLDIVFSPSILRNAEVYSFEEESQ